MSNTLYTIGYEATSAESFLKKLESAGVEMVLDVRELGSPRELRHKLRETKDFTAFTRGYLLYMKKQMEHVRTVKDLVYEKTCCLLCFEKNHDECHRKFVALEVKAVARNGLQIVHL